MNERDFEIEKNAMIDFQELLDELRKDREERDERIYNLALESIERNKDILDALGSDYDENGIPYWRKKINIVENFISAEECQKIINYMDKVSFPGPDPLVNFVSLANETVVFNMKHDNEFPNANEYINNIVLQIQDVVSRTYDVELEVKSSNYVDMTVGSKLLMHVDTEASNDPLDDRDTEFASEFEFAALVYLNDDYEGGYIHFPKQGFKQIPKPGTLIYFRGTDDVPHEVTEVLGGNRKNIASFYRRKK
jgi:uncharacterized protein (DUF1499 family)